MATASGCAFGGHRCADADWIPGTSHRAVQKTESLDNFGIGFPLIMRNQIRRWYTKAHGPLPTTSIADHACNLLHLHILLQE